LRRGERRARDLAAAGATVVQLDEPWLRNNVEAARRCAVKAINARSKASRHDRAASVLRLRASRHRQADGYSFLPELADTIAQQISIEAAQPKLDLGVLKIFKETVILGSSTSATTPSRATRLLRPHPRRAEIRRFGPADPGTRLRHEITCRVTWLSAS